MCAAVSRSTVDVNRGDPDSELFSSSVKPCDFWPCWCCTDACPAEGDIAAEWLKPEARDRTEAEALNYKTTWGCFLTELPHVPFSRLHSRLWLTILMKPKTISHCNSCISRVCVLFIQDHWSVCGMSNLWECDEWKPRGQVFGCFTLWEY